MIIPLTEIMKFRIKAGVDDIGVMSDLYLDDRHWHARYFLVNAATWLKPEHEALLYVQDLESIHRADKSLTFKLTRDQLARRPSCGVARPVCASLVSALHDYYQWPRYWEEELGLETPPLYHISHDAAPACLSIETPEPASPALRSANEMVRCQVQAEGRPIGDIRDLLIDLGEWTVRYMVVQLQDDHKQVVLSPRLINKIDEAGQSMSVDFSERMLRHSPNYNRSAPVMMTYDDGVTDYYYSPSKWLLNYNPNQMISYNDYQLLKK